MNLICVKTLLLATFLFCFAFGTAPTNGAPVQSVYSRKATPDPYFNTQINAAKKLVRETPAITPSTQASPRAKSEWAFPAMEKVPTNDSIRLDIPKPTLDGRWEPPKTAFAPATSGSSGTAQPLTSASLGPSAVSQNQIAAPKSTIIRERATPTPTQSPNDFGGNDFGGGDFAANDFSVNNVRGISNGSTVANPPALNFPKASKETNPQSQITPVSFQQDAEHVPEQEMVERKNPDQVRPTLTQPATVTQTSVTQIETYEPTQVLALVGSEPIFVGDLFFEVNQLIEQFMPTAPPEIKDRERRKLIKRLLPKFVDQKLLYLGALEMLPDGADVNSILGQASKEFNKNALPKMLESSGVKNENDFDAQLRGQGYSLRKLRESWAKDQFTKYFMTQQIKVDGEVTHQQMLDAYREKKEDYAQPAKARWEQIMIRFDKSKSRADAEAQLVELGNQIVYGANFKAVAKKSSHGFRAPDGGQHDWTTKGSLVLSNLDEAIFSLPVGELSDKIETQDGFHIIRVLERSDAKYKSFLETQSEIKAAIIEEKRNKAFEVHLKRLRTEVPVEYYDFDDRVADAEVASPAPSATSDFFRAP